MVVRSSMSFRSSISSNYFSINIFTHNWLSTDLRPNQSQSNPGPQWIYSIICDTQSLTFSQHYLWLLVSALEVVYPFIDHWVNVIVLKIYISWKPFQKVLERPYVHKYYKIITVTHLRVAWQTKPDGKTFLLAAQLLLRQVHSDIGLQRRQRIQDNRSAKIRLKILRHIVCGWSTSTLINSLIKSEYLCKSKLVMQSFILYSQTKVSQPIIDIYAASILHKICCV